MVTQFSPIYLGVTTPNNPLAYWLLQAPEGQQLNVTLMDFTPAVKSPVSPAAAAGRRGDGDAGWCPVIVQLHELGTSGLVDAAPRETVVRACDSRVRKRLVYTSRSSKVRVIMPLTAAFARQQRPEQPVVGYYLLYFEGIELFPHQLPFSRQKKFPVFSTQICNKEI